MKILKGSSAVPVPASAGPDPRRARSPDRTWTIRILACMLPLPLLPGPLEGDQILRHSPLVAMRVEIADVRADRWRIVPDLGAVDLLTADLDHLEAARSD